MSLPKIEALLPHHTQLLAGVRPQTALAEYIPQHLLAFDVYTNKPLRNVGEAIPAPLGAIYNWVQRALPCPIPECVMRLVVQHNRDERTALTLLSHLTSLVIHSVAALHNADRPFLQFAVAYPSAYQIEEAFSAYWALLTQTFAPEWEHCISVSREDYSQSSDQEVDVAIYLTAEKEVSSQALEWIATKRASLLVACHNAERITAQRRFVPLSSSTPVWTEQHFQPWIAKHAPKRLLTTDYPEGGMLYIGSLRACLIELLVGIVPWGQPTLVVVPNDVALVMTKIYLQEMGIDAVGSITMGTPTELWQEKWNALLQNTRLVLLCTSNQLLHPFWKVCKDFWQPHHILYASVEALSPWHNPNYSLEEAYWKRLYQLFPKACYWFHSDRIDTQDVAHLLALLPIHRSVGTPLSIDNIPPYPLGNIAWVSVSDTNRPASYQIGKQEVLEVLLKGNTNQPWTVLCPHTKGRIGVADGVFRGIASWVNTFTLEKQRPITTIIDNEHYQHLDALRLGHAQGIVAFAPLQAYALPYATSVYCLGLPENRKALFALNQPEQPTHFVLTEQAHIEKDTLLFRLKGSFWGEEREVAIALIVLKILVLGDRLTLTYPSPISDYIDLWLGKQGQKPIAYHHAEGEKAKRYRYVLLRTLSTLQAAECIKGFSYCLDRELLEVTLAESVDTYRLRKYIETRYTCYYPFFLKEIDAIVHHFYSNENTATDSTTPTTGIEEISAIQRLWLWLRKQLRLR